MIHLTHFPLGTTLPGDPTAAALRWMGRWWLRRWEAACRQAERPQRFVPYY